ncbi:hypothetical protein ACUXCC_002922 [Cytobacillus horneckiae]|uniref:hypothetical protein n=1 Tax=Cytobacillus horneckiae TaxID=549687 RepID=UPI0019D0AFD6|nr:hypothetical protein [Cytobacillus horneckiae]MBN6887775.1 hypothetical protein [Cytobacillus horneckiae]
MSENKKKIKTKAINALLMEHLNERVYTVTRNENGSKSNDLMVIHKTNIELYHATKKVENDKEILDDVRKIKTFDFSEFNSVTIDKFAISTKYVFNTGLELKVDASDDLTSALNSFGVQTNILERKWYNKILGFRSKKKWKMAIASIMYLFMALVIFNIAYESDAEKADKVAAQEKIEAEQVKLEAERDAKAKAKEEEKQKQKEEKAAKVKKEQEERDRLEESFKEAAAVMVQESQGVIADVKINQANDYFQVDVYVDESTWAISNESEKLSFATTVGTSIENALAPHNTYVDIRSNVNDDVVATWKLFGGWKIKR